MQKEEKKIPDSTAALNCKTAGIFQCNQILDEFSFHFSIIRSLQTTVLNKIFLVMMKIGKSSAACAVCVTVKIRGQTLVALNLCQ